MLTELQIPVKLTLLQVNRPILLIILGKQDIPGILPLALTSIMKAAENKLIQSELFVNFIEIYNEVVYDLLANTKDKGKKKVDLKENRNKTFYVKSKFL